MTQPLNLIAVLPQDLLTDLVGTWLYWKDLSKMDAANCSHKIRSSFLSAVRTRPFALHYVARENSELNKSDENWLSYFTWLYTRKIAVTALLLPPILATSLPLCGKLLHAQGSSLQQIEFLDGWSTSKVCTVCKEIGQHCYQLNVISLPEHYVEGPAKVTPHLDDALLAIAQGCPHLHTVITKATNLSNDFLLALAKHCPMLEELSVANARMCDAGIRAMAEKCRHLRKWTCVDTSGVTNVGREAIGRYCKELTELHMEYGPIPFNDEGLEAAIVASW